MIVLKDAINEACILIFPIAVVNRQYIRGERRAFFCMDDSQEITQLVVKSFNDYWVRGLSIWLSPVVPLESAIRCNGPTGYRRCPVQTFRISGQVRWYAYGASFTRWAWSVLQSSASSRSYRLLTYRGDRPSILRLIVSAFMQPGTSTIILLCFDRWAVTRCRGVF